jgi:hypothetical protein
MVPACLDSGCNLSRVSVRDWSEDFLRDHQDLILEFKIPAGYGYWDLSAWLCGRFIQGPL